MSLSLIGLAIKLLYLHIPNATFHPPLPLSWKYFCKIAAFEVWMFVVLMKKFVISLVSVFLVLAAGYLLFSALFEQVPAKERYITVVAQWQAIEDRVLASAVLEPAQMVTVGARASGQVLKLHARLGMAVKSGDLIAEIDSQPQRNALNSSLAVLASVKAQRAVRVVNLRQAQRVFKRQAALLAADAVSRDAYDVAVASRDALADEITSYDAQIDQAAASVQAARTDLSYTRISAPIDGVVIAVVTEEGRTVNAFQSAPAIVILAKLDRMKVKAEISEADVLRVKPGQPACFTVLGAPDQPYCATLQALEPAPPSIVAKAEEFNVAGGAQSATTTKTAVYYNGLFEVPNPDGRLRPLMTAQVYIVLGRAEHALTLPLVALGARQGDGRYRVEVLDAHRNAEQRAITIGINNGSRVEVLAGLKAGEQVILGDSAQATQGGDNWGDR